MYVDEQTARDEHGAMVRVESEVSDRLGRIAIEDERDAAFPIRAITNRIPAGKGPGKTYRYWWTNGWWGNQGYTPHCVAFAWVHWGEDGPRTREPFRRGEGPFHLPASIYNAAQDRDRWPGTDYDGTSVRAGAKVLRDLDYIHGYHWAESFDDVVRALLTTGPVVYGSWWYEGMIEPDEEGYIYPTGQRVGGHAYVLNGINTEQEKVRLKNSWGRGWGDRGAAWLTFEGAAKLLNEQGEACLAIPEGGR